MRLRLSIACLAVAACAGQDVGTETAASTSTRSYIVLSTDGTVPAGLAQKLASAGGTVSHPLPASCGAVLVDASSADFVTKAKKLAGVRSVVPDAKMQFAPPFSKTFRVDPGHVKNVAGDARVWSSTARTAGPPSAPAGIAEPWDPGYRAQWGLAAIGAKAAWDKGYFGQGVRVAVLDTGVAYCPYCGPPSTPPDRWTFHPDLAPNLNLELSTSFVPGETWYQPAFDPSIIYHGTHTMGIIGAAMNNGYVVGVAPEAELVAVKVLDDHTNQGSFGSILAGICYAASIHADVANMSLSGTFPRNGFCNPDFCVSASDVSEVVVAFNRAVNYAQNQGMTIVAAAGNDALDRDKTADLFTIPASLPHVITVSATGPVGWGVDARAASTFRPASYSDYGQKYITLAAPGGDWVFEPQDQWCTLQLSTFLLQAPCWALDMVISDYGDYSGILWAAGTSMAAPHIAGLAALYISASGGKLTPAQVEAALRQHALDLGKPGNDDHYGLGFGHFGACVPTTCADAGATCGTIVDGCGGTVECASCPAGDTCYHEQCCPAVAAVCASQGRACGQTWDECRGTTIDCGGCSSGQSCTYWGTCCVTTACDGRSCGFAYDYACGLYLECGAGCPDGQECNSSGACCTPTRACDQQSCGYIDDGCGNTIYCGCDYPQECSWQTSTCCTPTVSCDQVRCGSVDDGCGNYLYCGCDYPAECDWQTSTCCTPTQACDPQTCGYQDDGCGNYRYCGCPDGSVCDWQSGSCCTPTQTCASEGATCGTVVDDCGQQLNCGDCGTGETCFQNTCIPTPPNRIDCGCSDGVTQSYCQVAAGSECPDGVSEDRLCHLACASDGGVRWDGCAPDPVCSGPNPLPPPPTPAPPASPGPNLLGCACHDGFQVSVCVADCSTSASADGVCANLCSDHLGSASSTCAVQDAGCASAATPGTSLERCYCRGSTGSVIIDLCVQIADCFSGPDQDAICTPVCKDNGGLWGTGCIAGYSGCAGP
jgi:subtilisin family serine protease